MVCVLVIMYLIIVFECYRVIVIFFKMWLLFLKIKYVNLGVWLFCYVFFGFLLVILLKVWFFEDILYCFFEWLDFYCRVYEIYLVVVFIVV